MGETVLLSLTAGLSREASAGADAAVVVREGTVTREGRGAQALFREGSMRCCVSSLGITEGRGYDSMDALLLLLLLLL